MDTLLYVCGAILTYICSPDGSHSLAAAPERIRWTLCNPFHTVPDRLSRLSVFNSTVHVAELAGKVLRLLTPPELWGQYCGDMGHLSSLTTKYISEYCRIPGCAYVCGCALASGHVLMTFTPLTSGQCAVYKLAPCWGFCLVINAGSCTETQCLVGYWAGCVDLSQICTTLQTVGLHNRVEQEFLPGVRKLPLLGRRWKPYSSS